MKSTARVEWHAMISLQSNFSTSTMLTTKPKIWAKKAKKHTLNILLEGSGRVISAEKSVMILVVEQKDQKWDHLKPTVASNYPFPAKWLNLSRFHLLSQIIYGWGRDWTVQPVSSLHMRLFHRLFLRRGEVLRSAQLGGNYLTKGALNM